MGFRVATRMQAPYSCSSKPERFSRLIKRSRKGVGRRSRSARLPVIFPFGNPTSPQGGWMIGVRWTYLCDSKDGERVSEASARCCCLKHAPRNNKPRLLTPGDEAVIAQDSSIRRRTCRKSQGVLRRGELTRPSRRKEMRVDRFGNHFRIIVRNQVRPTRPRFMQMHPAAFAIWSIHVLRILNV
jgi:hypothetical protein